MPAISALEELLEEEEDTLTPILILFLSDGAPSDHTELTCRHGVKVRPGAECCSAAMFNVQLHGSLTAKVWNSDSHGLLECGNKSCRYVLKNNMERRCVEGIKRLGDRFGRDRIRLHTAAFGPPSEVRRGAALRGEERDRPQR